MPHVHLSECICATPQAVYELFCEPGQFPLFMPSVTSVEIVERGDGWAVTQWVTDLDGAPLEWQEIDRYDGENLVVAFRLVEGDVERFDGRWSFEACEGGTLASCELIYELGVSIIEEVVGPTIKEKIEHNIRLMLAAMKERLEAGASCGRNALCARSSH